MRNSVIRSFDFTPVEQVGNENDGRTLEGYGAVFGAPARIDNWEGNFEERIAPGAFRKTLSERTPIMQFDHGRDIRTGSVPIGKITDIREDERGLYVKARLFDNQVVEPIRQAIEGGAINGMSFRFQPVREEWRDQDGHLIRPDELGSLLYNSGDRGPLQRTLKEVRMSEVGPVVSPAYPATSVGVRSATPSEEDRQAYCEELVAQYQRTFVEDPEEVRAGQVGGPNTPQTPPGPAGPPVPSPMPGDKGGVVEEHRCAGLEVGEPDCPTPAVHSGGVRAMSNPKKPYGDVEYADPGYQKDGHHRYPIDTKAHAKAALAYINKGEDADKYSSADYAAVKAKIVAAAKKFGVSVSESKSSDDDAALIRDESTSESGKNTDAAGITASTSVGHDNPPKQNRKAAAMPKSIDELRSRLAEIDEQMVELAASEDETRSFDEETQGKWDALETERTEAEEAIRKIEQRAARLKSMSRESGSERSPYFKKDAGDIYDVARLRRENDTDAGFSRALRDNAMRAIEKADFSDVVSKERAQNQVDRLMRNVADSRDDFAKRLLATGSETYERAWAKQVMTGGTAYLTHEEREAIERAQTVSPNAGGGYAVPFQLDPTVMLDNPYTVNPIRNLARIVQITGKQWNGVVSTGATVQRGAEAATAPDSSFTLTQPTVTTNRVQGFVPFSIEIDLEWSALRSEITALLVDAKAREEDSFWTGNGVGTAPGGVVGTLAAANIFKTATAATLAAADIYATETNLAPRWRPRGQWCANKATFNLIRQFDNYGGANLWQRIGAGMPNELMGYPAHEVSAMSTGTASGTNAMLFGDFSQFLIVDRIGMTVELVPQVFDPANANRPTGQRGIYAIWMNNSTVLVNDGFAMLQIR